MAHIQYIETPAGRFAVLPEDEFRAIAEAAEDNADALIIAEFNRKLAMGEEELVPAEVVNRILDGENRIRIRREHRGMKAAELAEKAGVSQGFLSQLETGKREGSVTVLKAIAVALNLDLDDLVP